MFDLKEQIDLFLKCRLINNDLPDSSKKVLTRLLEIDKENNYKRISFILLFRILKTAQAISVSYKSNPLGRGLVFLLCQLLNPIIVDYFQKEDTIVFKQYLEKEFTNVKESVEKDFGNNSLSGDSKPCLLDSYNNYLFIWEQYTSWLYKDFAGILNLPMDLLKLKFQNPNVKLLEIIALSVYFIYVKLEYNSFAPEIKKKSNCGIIGYIDDIYSNENIINEYKSFDYHFEILFDKIINYIIPEDNKLNTGSLMNESYQQYVRSTSLPSYLRTLFLSDYAIAISSEYINKSMWTNETLMPLYNKVCNVSKYNNFDIDNTFIKNDNFKLINEYNYKKSINLFSLQNYSISFGGQTILSNVSLNIPSKKWICFVGSSGCGKTTLLKSLLKKNTFEGDIILLDQFNSYEYNNIKLDLNLINSSDGLFNTNSIYYNCIYFLNKEITKEETEKKLEILFKQFQMQELIPRMHESVTILSSGQRQRIKIIRLILSKRKIWFLDEFTSNLDGHTEHQVLHFAKQYQKTNQISVIHISHSENNQIYADYLMKIENQNVSIEIANQLV